MTTQSTTTEAALERCPFCGAKPRLIEIPNEVHYYVMCIECGACGSDLHGRQDAINAWNSRIPAPSVAPEVDHQCLLCGHASVDVDGVCMMNVPTCSDEAHDWRRCGCKCKFRDAPASPVAPVEQSDELAKLRQAIGWICDAADAAYIEDADDERIHEIFNIAAQAAGITRRLPDEYGRFNETSIG